LRAAQALAWQYQIYRSPHAYELALAGMGILVVILSTVTRRARKFIFSLSTGERIIIRETIIKMAANYRDFGWERFVRPRTRNKSTER
jgi:hypothetical protein